MHRNIALWTLTAALATAASAQLMSVPGEWPAWRGPDRTGVSAETGLLNEWPAGGPKLAWKATGLGQGYSTPSVAGGRIYLLGTPDGGETESLIALDAKTGRAVWKTPFGRLQGGKPGPRSTPTFVDGRLYVISSDGKLLCAAAADGREIWRKDLVKEFSGKCGGWAYAESPLIDGDRLICTPGGPASTVVALDRTTGAKQWACAVTKESADRKRSYATAGYASAIAIECGGVRQYVQFLDGGVIGVSAADGRLLWTYDRPASATANCSTPVFRDGIVWAASAYNTGGGAARIEKKGDGFEATELYHLKDVLNHHGGTVLVGDHLYGTGASELFCIEFKTGHIVWKERGVGKGSVAVAGGMIYHRSENGPVALVEASPDGYREDGRFDQPERSAEKAWPYPVIAGGRLLLRDQDKLFCYDVHR